MAIRSGGRSVWSSFCRAELSDAPGASCAYACTVPRTAAKAIRSAANDTFISTSVRRLRRRRILLSRLSCLELGDSFRRSDQSKVCQAEEKPMLHDAGDAGKPFGQRFWVGNAAKRCVDHAVSVVGDERRAAPRPERNCRLQTKLF